MDSTKEDELIKRIERFVIDEGKIASYKWVSRSMDIHINQAKQLLQKFMNTRAKHYEDSISANHLVSGKHIDGSRSVVIVNDSELEKTKSSFIDVLSEHVYSVQNSKSLADYEVLYAVDTFKDTSSAKSGLITCSLCVPREIVETAPRPEVTKKPLVTKDSSNKQKEVVKPAVKKEEVKETKPVVKNENVKVEKPGAQKNAISSMFSAQQKKAQVSAKKVDEGKESENVEPEVVETPVEVKPKKENSTKAAKKIPQKRPSKKVQEEKQEQKRKRIRVLSDSEDSDQDIERVPSPEPEPEPSAGVTLSDDEEVASKRHTSSGDVGHKKKKRKLVEKQEIDEQGYIQTTKEYVFETDSEPESEPTKPSVSEKKTPPAADKPKPAAAKKSASPKKGKGKAANDGRKQQTLLSFFKKT